MNTQRGRGFCALGIILAALAAVSCIGPTGIEVKATVNMTNEGIIWKGEALGHSDALDKWAPLQRDYMYRNIIDNCIYRYNGLEWILWVNGILPVIKTNIMVHGDYIPQAGDYFPVLMSFTDGSVANGYISTGATAAGDIEDADTGKVMLYDEYWNNVAAGKTYHTLTVLDTSGDGDNERILMGRAFAAGAVPPDDVVPLELDAQRKLQPRATVANPNDLTGGDYIPIYTVEELMWINKSGNLIKKYLQMADLDLLGNPPSNGITPTLEKHNWIPVGKSSTAAFKGTFDGNGYEIRNLYVNATTNNGSGLFGYASGGAILKNIRIASGSVTAPQKAGGIVGQAQNVTITRCVNNADISVNSNYNEAYAGGIAGYVTVTTGGVSAIEDCGNTGSIICEDTFKINSKYTGGIAGWLKGTTTVSRCFNRGSVTGKGDTGGIAGSIQTGTTIVDISACYNKGEIRTVTSEATVFENLYKNTGGLAGSTDGTVNITASYSIGTVVGDPKLTSAWGSVNTSFLIGKILGGTTTISYCYYQNRSYRANSGAEYPFPPDEASPTDIDSAYFSRLDWPTTNTPGWNLTDWSSLGNWVDYLDDPLYEDLSIGAGFYSNFPMLRWEQPLAWDRELPLPWEGQY